MSDASAGFTAGLLAGAAGAAAQNAATYIDQAIRSDAPTISPAGPGPARTAAKVTDQPERAAALGSLGGLSIGAVIGGLAGSLRGVSITPPQPVAALVVGLAAMAAGEGLAVATGSARRDWHSRANLLRDLWPHLAYGAVTVSTLHRLLDLETSHVER